MASDSSNRRKKRRKGTTARQPRNKTTAQSSDARTVVARHRPDENIWELVHPRCAREREEDLAEVRKMIDAGEMDVAREELRWLLQGCTDCLEAHRMLGEIALSDDDLPLARGHFGYAFRLGAKALEASGVTGPLPYRLPANQGFIESGKALAWCLKQLSKPKMAAEVIQTLLACDPTDPLGVTNLMATGEC